jgi:uncharacterized protein
VKFVLETGSRILIHGYDVGSVSISGIHPDNPDTQSEILSEWDAENQLGIFRKSIILRSNGFMQNWAPQTHADLNPEHFSGFAELQPEIVLLGMGSQLRFPPQDCLAVLQQHNLGYEVMDTPAACRTFNVLAAEGRDVTMGLLMLV